MNFNYEYRIHTQILRKPLCHECIIWLNMIFFFNMNINFIPKTFFFFMKKGIITNVLFLPLNYIHA